MPLFPRNARREPTNGMTASAVRLDTSQYLSQDNYAVRIKDWQARTLRFSNMIPEVSSAGKFVENAIGRVTWEPVIWRDQDFYAVEDPLADDLVDSLRTLDAGRLARMLFTVGEAYVVVTPYEAIKGKPAYNYWNPIGSEYYWRSVSICELDVVDGNYVIKESANTRNAGQKLLDGQEIYRIWTPDQEYGQSAWSSHLAMLDILEAMVLHTIADKIFALSVVANAGILYIPNDDFLPEPFDNTGPPLPGTVRAFDEEMNEAMRLALSNNSGTESISPLKMYGAAANANGLKHLLLDREDNADAYAARMAAYRLRYATGVDLPAEVVTGIADSNHWSSWKVDQNTWTYHLAPMAFQIADAISEAWLIPKLVQAKVADAQLYAINPNGRNVVSKPDNTPTILRLYELGAITAQATLEGLDMPVDWATDEFNPAQDPGSGPEYVQPKADTTEPPTRTTGDTPPAVKAASAAPEWFNEVARIEGALYEQVLSEMRRAATKAVTLTSVKTADATQDQNAGDAARDTGIGAIILTLLLRGAKDRMQASGSTEEQILEYLRVRGGAIADAASYSTSYIADLLAGRAHRESLLNPDGSAVPSDYVPPVASLAVMAIAAGGAAAEWNPSLSKTDQPVQNWNADLIWLEMVARATGMRLGLEFIWERGHPTHPYPDHVVLQGETWREGEVNPTLPWFPGDHHGCQCRIIARPHIPV